MHAIVYSHGHQGYNAAVDVWQRHNAERGDAPPRLVGHANVLRRFDRYRETHELQQRMASVQFPARDAIPARCPRRGDAAARSDRDIPPT